MKNKKLTNWWGQEKFHIHCLTSYCLKCNSFEVSCTTEQSQRLFETIFSMQKLWIVRWELFKIWPIEFCWIRLLQFPNSFSNSQVSSASNSQPCMWWPYAPHWHDFVTYSHYSYPFCSWSENGNWRHMRCSCSGCWSGRPSKIWWFMVKLFLSYATCSLCDG